MGNYTIENYDFLELVSQELNIDKATFLKLFSERGQTKVIKDEFNRICQFYRLALLMHSDGVLHERETNENKRIRHQYGIEPVCYKTSFTVNEIFAKSNGSARSIVSLV